MKDAIKSGKRIIDSFKYDEPRHLLIPEEANLLVDGHNRIHRMEIVRGQTDQVIISDHKITIQLRDGAMDEAASSFHGNEPLRIKQPNRGTANWLTITINEAYWTFYGVPETGAMYAPTATVRTSDDVNGNEVAPFSLTISSAGLVYVCLEFVETSPGSFTWTYTAYDADPGGWVSYGYNDNKHRIIAYIDSLTNAAAQELIISQLLLGHQTVAASGTVGNVSWGNILADDLGFTRPSQTTTRGLVVAGFPADGFYLYIGGGGGVGPGNDWILLASD